MLDLLLVVGAMALLWWASGIYTNVSLRIMTSETEKGTKLAMAVSIACVILSAVLLYIGIK